MAEQSSREHAVILHADVVGSIAVLAQRLEQLVEPGGVCISVAVQRLLRQRLRKGVSTANAQ